MGVFISVIIPVYNDPNGLHDTVMALVRQNYEREKYEIIIVDNGSMDSTRKLAQSFQSTYQGRIQVEVEDKRQGSYAARNKGIKAARGSLLCFMDADVIAPPNYLSEISKYFEKVGNDYLGCNVKMILKRDTLAAKYNYINGFNVEASIRRDSYTPTCNLVGKRSAIAETGFFDDRLEGGGDFEFGKRAKTAGLQLSYANDIVLYHPTRCKYSALVTKAKRVGRGNAQLAHYYPNQYDFVYERHFNLKRFIPENPIKCYRRFKSEGFTMTLITAVVLSFYHLPIRAIAALACFREARRLRCMHIPE